MKASINAVKIGKTVNLSINGKLRKKNCTTNEDAEEFYKLILEAKANPSDEAIEKLYIYLNTNLRVALDCGLESDPDTGLIFLAGFNTPVPEDLVDIIKEYHEHGYPMTPIVNFWSLLMINPDTRVRKSLFNFIRTHDFVLTDNGYMIVYKSVWVREDGELFTVDLKMIEAIESNYTHVVEDWGTSAKRYMMYKDENDDYKITKTVTINKWDLEKKRVELIGNLDELYNNQDQFKIRNGKTKFTDRYTKSMNIEIGKPVKMERKDCDSDPAKDCSYGLHVGATNYVNTFGRDRKAVLMCYVNPANVVAVPNYNHSKMRVTEYFPFGLANYEDGKIDIIEQKYFESDYTQYEKDELEAMIEKVKNEEIPFDKSIGCEDETRSLEELKKIIENRLVTIE